ncbi:MAG TPA: ABC transporter ATP-binding protein [Polyangiales bacterium]|nr:ABC transporter ATP-binding protein [Polyangiales bacterium]
MSAALSVRDLCVYFRTEQGEVKAVDGVSFDVQPGEVLGIVGESGSGKSVTSLAVMGLLPQPPAHFPRGEVLFGGKSLLRSSDRELRAIRGKRIAMIFQDPMTSLNPYLTIERQLSEVLELHESLSRSAARQRAVAMLAKVGIPDAERRIDSYPHELSGGMRQRVMIAMALLCGPELLIADEPTTAVDVTIQAQILALIKELQAGSAMSVILITHDLGVVAGMAHRVAVMYAGRIVEAAETSELFENPKHPYTRALLASVPRLDTPPGTALASIPGLPPDLSNLDAGCPFRPRCPLAMPRCASAYPPNFGDAKHPVHCYAVEEGKL